MLTTTIDGLWVLQVLTGVEVLAPELGLRPHLPRVESRESALAMPIATELAEAGAIDPDGRVDDPVAEWLTVLARRDIGLVADLRTPEAATPTRVLLARFARWWAVCERVDDLIRIGPAGTSTAEASATAVIGAQIERLCGTAEPAAMRPATIDGAVLATVRGTGELRSLLDRCRLDGDQLRLLMLAADPVRSARASLVAVQSGAVAQRPTGAVVDGGAVTVIDTPEGRLLAETVRRDDRPWLIMSPGGPAAVVSAIRAMLRRLPTEADWPLYRKVV
ncbi:ESX secretion-associated protein EspG [Mycolicibacterium brumae]|uniref:ESX secretion-associated protein EspG n=1 Tax=Mycolicibacterium brumae TaxID=85968 RepID=A0A2G5PA70_9MYCO|nr:ESX secretion-associated protein EspG [Mycolicibacterium brumae]MCV7192919.1 ESX secretion-associated protein EspG [Mycolicibacterium brumae]PIB75242.1 ESX secretion-associated protein EspG [Mycolicibacterium brumae]RWA23508.1 hypothetical protein MBRU_01405 [Mycolicibacterium brumae DSM 44177]UWW08562.1 ESX secretion-associated protein EspG2 [Mycolicibacterium brumae]